MNHHRLFASKDAPTIFRLCAHLYHIAEWDQNYGHRCKS